MAVFQIAYNLKGALAGLDGIASGTYVFTISPIAGQVFKTCQTVWISQRLQLDIDRIYRVIIVDIEVGYFILIFGLYCLHNSSIMQKSLQNYEIFMNYA